MVERPIKPPSFKRNPVPSPAAAAPPANSVSAAVGNLPIPSGGMVMTDATRKNLQLLGWKEGDPIPDELGRRISAWKRKREVDLASATHGFKPGDRVKINRSIDIADMPPEEQAELRKVLADYREEVAEQNQADAAQAKLDAQFKGAHPSVAAAAAAATRAAHTMPKVELVSRRQQQPPEPVPMTQEEALAAALPHPELAPIAQPTPNAGSEPPPAAATVTENQEVGDAGLDSRAIHCPRCLWPVADEFKIEITQRDRQTFMATLLGSGRFVKEFSVMGGEMTLTLRSLLTTEVDLVFRQLNYDSRVGVIAGDGDFWLKLEAYRTCCTLQSISGRSGTTILEMPPLFDIPWDGDDSGYNSDTRLKDVLQWFNVNVVANSSLQRIISQHYRQFQRLVEALEAQVAEPDFWKGIESQP